MLFMGDKFEQILETNQRHLLEQQNYHSAELQVHAPKALYVKKKNPKQNKTPPNKKNHQLVKYGLMLGKETSFLWSIASGVIEFWKQLSKILLPRAGKLHPEWFKTWQCF